MKELTLQIEILDYWHAGSGLSRGEDIDAAVIRDDDGLPYLPGRTLKGLLREACTIASDYHKASTIHRDELKKLFGQDSQSEKQSDESMATNPGSTPGCIIVSNASLPDRIRDPLCASGEVSIQHLFTNIASCTIGKDGLAIDKHLRNIEVVIPCELNAQVRIHDDQVFEERAITILKETAPLIRQLGSHRHRGLGRCRCTCSINEMSDAS